MKEYDEELHKNIDSFERDVKRLLRRLDRHERKPAEAASELAFAAFREQGRLPDKPLDKSPYQLKKIYSQGLLEQKEIDDEFLLKFTQLSVVYTQAIEKQISILRKEGNDEHADSLLQEIDATQNDMARFMRILRNLEPDPEPEEEKKDKK